MTRIAIIGAGNIGTRHAKWAAEYGNLVAVCDVVKRKANKLAKEYECRAYSDFLSMLWDDELNIDLVAICVPNYLHKIITVIALDYCNVLCEKPMALTTKDCEEMIQAAEKANKRLFIVKQNRFNAPVQLTKNLLDEGNLGRVLSVHLTCAWCRDKEYYEKSNWHGSIYKDGGILFTQFIHFIDLMHYLVGDIDKVQAMSENFTNKAGFPDTYVTSFKFHNGALGTAHFTINSYGENMEGSLIIFGEKGTIKIGGKYLNKIEYQNIKGETLYSPTTENKCNDYGSYQGSSSKHDEVYKNIISVLEKGDKVMATSLDGMKAVKTVEKILEACK